MSLQNPEVFEAAHRQLVRWFRILPACLRLESMQLPGDLEVATDKEWTGLERFHAKAFDIFNQLTADQHGKVGGLTIRALRLQTERRLLSDRHRGPNSIGLGNPETDSDRGARFRPESLFRRKDLARGITDYVWRSAFKVWRLMLSPRSRHLNPT